MEKLEQRFKLLREARVKGSRVSSFLKKLKQRFKRFKLPQEAKTNGANPPYMCIEGRACAYQLAQLVCIMPEKGKENVSARKSGRLTKTMVGRQKTIPTGQYLWPVARKQGRWPQAMAGEVWGWPTSYFPPSEAKQQVFGAKPNTKQTSREVLRQGV